MQSHRSRPQAIVFSALLCLVVASSRSQSNQANVPFVDAQVTIDGIFSPGEWDGALKIFVDGLTPQQNPGWNPLNGNAIALDNLSYDLYLMHDGESFYVAFDVTDNSVSDDYTASRPLHTEVWNDDCTEVFIDGDLDRDATESTGGSPQGDRDWREGMQPHFGVRGQSHWENNSGYKDRTWWAATTRTDKGYRTEYRFAFHGIDTADGEAEYEPLKTGDTIGFSALVNDDDFGGDRENQLAWIGGGTNDSLFRSQWNWGYATMMPPPGYVTPGIPTRAENTSLLIDQVPNENPGVLTAERVFPQLAFERPLLLIESPDTSQRLFVLEQRGRIRSFPRITNAAPNQVTTFLDIASLARSPLDGSGELEEGLLGLAFDPAFASNGQFYVYYTPRSNPRRSRISRFTASPPSAATVSTSTEQVILEFSQPAANHNGGMIAFGPDGMLYIGTGDGGGAGDNAGAGNNAQNTTNLLGAMLRIDVRGTPDAGLAYRIPPDNPFFVTGPAGTSTRKDIWAYGLRNPWRWSFDAQTSALMLADVGQSAWEEVNVIERGRNYGWRIMEGPACYNASTCNTQGLTLPLAWYPHSEGLSVTGGFTYYGPDVPSLFGKYLFGDYVTGRVWSMIYDPETATATTPVLVTQLSGVQLAAFGQDSTGEVYILNHANGAILVLRPGDAPNPDNLVTTNPAPPVRGQQVTIVYDATNRPLDGQQLVRIHSGINGWSGVTQVDMTNIGNNRHSITRTVASNATVLDMAFTNGNGLWDNNGGEDWHIQTVALAPPQTLANVLSEACAGTRPFPTRLSDIPALLQAGLGVDQTNLGIIPYEPSAKLWSDGSLKERFMALPGLDLVGYTANTGWNFANNTVLIKNFVLPLDERNPSASLQRIETRLMVKHCDEWYGFSYEWNEQQTDAVLLTTSKRRAFELIDPQGGIISYEWLYPSRTQCNVCHTQASNHVLGLSTAQMNHEMLYPRSGVVDNQLRALQHIRLFGEPGLPGPPEGLPRMPDSNDPSASIRDRARAYLHANCASCHMPGGGGGGNFDLRWHIADEDTRIIDVPPANPMGLADARLVAPGDPERSTIFRRINTTDPTVRMPPLATSRIDTQGRDVIRQWIESLDDENPDGEGTRWRTY